MVGDIIADSRATSPGIRSHLDERPPHRVAAPPDAACGSGLELRGLIIILPETEQLVLRRLAVFQGDFTINAAAAVVTDERIGTADVFETIANLAAKSLISTDISSDVTYHRLPPPEDPGHHRDLYKLSLTVPRF
jgi:hypothetical protein